MAGRLAAKVFVITGGGTGIGRAVAGRVVAEGGAVVIAGRRRDVGEAAAAELRRGGGQARFVASDVTVAADAERLAERAVAEFGRLDGAFNNAGGVSATGPVQTIEDTAWRAALDQNLTSVFYSLKVLIRAILATAGRGSIVNNASIGGVRGIPGLAAYVAAKHGVVGLTRAAALDGAVQGVRVNALVTGNVDTPLYRRLVGAPTEGELPGPAPIPPVGWPARTRSRRSWPSCSATNRSSSPARRWPSTGAAPPRGEPHSRAESRAPRTVVTSSPAANTRPAHSAPPRSCGGRPGHSSGLPQPATSPISASIT
jgi:NAD(P)-dependent dehydrogenase (short-subunit alcohol dehydrogenase family)